MTTRHVYYAVKGGQVVGLFADIGPAIADDIAEAIREGAAIQRAPLGLAPSIYAPLPPESVGAQMIAQERRRQVQEEGWSPEHDDRRDEGEMASAAACYAGITTYPETIRRMYAPQRTPLGGWPWDKDWWKPSEDPLRNLVRAGALIAAEIDRRRRKAAHEAERKDGAA